METSRPRSERRSTGKHLSLSLLFHFMKITGYPHDVPDPLTLRCKLSDLEQDETKGVQMSSRQRHHPGRKQPTRRRTAESFPAVRRRILFAVSSILLAANVGRYVPELFTMPKGLNPETIATTVFVLQWGYTLYLFMVGYVGLKSKLSRLVECIRYYEETFGYSFDVERFNRNLQRFLVFSHVIVVFSPVVYFVPAVIYLPEFKKQLAPFDQAEGVVFIIVCVAFCLAFILVIYTFAAVAFVLVVLSLVVRKEFKFLTESMTRLLSRRKPSLARFQSEINTKTSCAQSDVDDCLDEGKREENSTVVHRNKSNPGKNDTTATQQANINDKANRELSVDSFSAINKTQRNPTDCSVVGICLANVNPPGITEERDPVEDRLQQGTVGEDIHKTTIVSPGNQQDASLEDEHELHAEINIEVESTETTSAQKSESQQKSNLPLSSETLEALPISFTTPEKVEQENDHDLDLDLVSDSVETTSQQKATLQLSSESVEALPILFTTPEKVEQKNDHNLDLRSDSIETTFGMLCDQHETVCDLVQKVGQCFCHFYPTQYVHGITTLCFVVFTLASGALPSADLMVFAGILVTTVEQLIIFTLVACAVNDAAKTILAPIFAANKANLSASLLQKMQFVVTRLTAEEVGYHVYGLFVVSRPTILMLGGTVLTYTVVVVQFQMGSCTCSPCPANVSLV